jgi:hypothetical protein
MLLALPMAPPLEAQTPPPGWLVGAAIGPGLRKGEGIFAIKKRRRPLVAKI